MPNWFTNDELREHQGAPETQLGDDNDLPEQQADPSEKAKVPSTIELGLASASNPPPQAHDYEEQMKLETILLNKTLTERDLETISGDNKDDADKQQPPTEKIEEPESVKLDMEDLNKGAEDGNPMSPNVRTEESEFKTPIAAESQPEIVTPSMFLNDEEDPDMVQVPEVIKRKKNVPIKLRSPFLTQYSHLLIGTDDMDQQEIDMRCLLDYGFGEGPPS
ncbi:hypothetical protein SOVF_022030, partial [Spinacia oleracea]